MLRDHTAIAAGSPDARGFLALSAVTGEPLQADTAAGAPEADTTALVGSEAGGAAMDETAGPQGMPGAPRTAGSALVADDEQANVAAAVGDVASADGSGASTVPDAPAPLQPSSEGLRVQPANTAVEKLPGWAVPGIEEVLPPPSEFVRVSVNPAASDEIAPPTTLGRIALENALPGSPESEWRLTERDRSIEGFATEFSVDQGETVSFKIATDSTDYRIDIYRLGYYGGMGARKVATIERQSETPQVQPHPIVDMERGLIDCGNWGVSAEWEVPEDAVSGVYLAVMRRQDGTEGANEIPFVVRGDGTASDIVFQTSDTTWQAYNPWGGANFYGGDVPVDPEEIISYNPPNCSCGLNAIGRAYAVSYNRPFLHSEIYAWGPQNYLFGVEYSAIRWIEQNGYDVSYIGGADTARAGAQLLDHQMFLSVGHDEYWTAEQRANVEAARDAGVNLSFFSGNEVYWKARWETSIDGDGMPYRTLVCYKETWAGTSIDPSGTSTGTWRDERFWDEGQEPENSLTGTMFQVDAYRLDTISVPYDFSQFRFWRNTGMSTLQVGETGALVGNLLGYEWDSDVDNGFRPAGLINLSLTTVEVDTFLMDFGSTVGPGEATHSLTMYRAESGAIVFGAGTVYWSWGLDDNHDNEPTPTDPNVQQAMVNLFADMGIQPDTLEASLVLAAPSSDALAPSSQISAVFEGATFVDGQTVTITGTAADGGGGKVAGIEVSLDGGNSWRKATGRETWSYTGQVGPVGSYPILSRAVDDSLNLETPGPGRAVTVTLPETSSFWTYADVPADLYVDDNMPIELGLRFTAQTNGSITGVRFYKSFLNQGQHTAHLWTASGTLLAAAPFTNETTSGWQSVSFAQPVAIAAGTTYVASYHSAGRYSVDTGYFDAPRQSGPLTASNGAGVYGYGDVGTFPDGTYLDQNYWVDVVFQEEPNQPPVAVADAGFTTAHETPLVLAAAALTANDTDANGDPLTITAVGSATNGSVVLNQAAQTVTFTPGPGYSGAAGFGYTISDGRGGSTSASVGLTVTEPGIGLSLFSPAAVPAILSSGDPDPVELGVKFRADSAGTISGIRFYKGPQNTGVHTGRLWTASGTVLATATFTNETASGWQTVSFASPVAIAANTTYVASYHTSGNYALDVNYFTVETVNGPLRAPSSAAAGGNGVYAYGAPGSFPNNSYNSSNYWVDVVYNETVEENQVPVAVADAGFSTAHETPLVLAAAALTGNDTDGNGDPLTITAVGSATNGSVVLDPVAQTVTFTPGAGYSGAAGFDYTISDGRGGSASATVGLTVNEPGIGLSLFSSGDVPGTISSGDPNPVELGVKFRADSAGTISGIRFYKGPQNTGVHTGRLWTASGTVLATATFTNETASGWQTVSFASPVAIAANTTYVASYHTNGNYAVDANYFAAETVNGPLRAPSSAAGGGNGVYAYGAPGSFPTGSYNGSNYWVDVVYNETVEENQAPVAVADAGFSTAHETPLVLAAAALTGNDTDGNGDPLTITVVGSATNGSVVLDPVAQTVTFTPGAGYSGAAGFDYTISDGRGGSASATVGLTVNEPGIGLSLFSSGDVPAVLAANDPDPVELGIKFQADVAGSITGVRFYKAAENVGTHEAHIWTAAGSLLATATFTAETASGWQTASFASPVAIAADTTYVASYHTNGFYSATPAFFGGELSNGPLRALASSTAGGNGVYAYGPSGVFPTESYNQTNYWVDVVFDTHLTA